MTRPVVPGCAGCAMAHPNFGRSVKPISTRGDRLCPPTYYWHTRVFRPSDGPEHDKKHMTKVSFAFKWLNHAENQVSLKNPNLNIMKFFTKVLNFNFCMIWYPLQVVTRCSNWNTKIWLRTCCSRQESNPITDFFSDRITKHCTKVGTTIHRIYSRNARLDVCRTSSFIAKGIY